MESLTTAFGTALSTIQTNAESLMGTALPVALGIAGVVIAVNIGWRLFKRFSRG